MAVDVSKPITNPKLLELMKQRTEIMKANDKDGFNRIMNEIAQELCMNANLLAPVHFSKQPEIGENGKAVVKEDTTIGFYLLTGNENTRWHPVFTDWEELVKLKTNEEHPQTMVMTFDDLSGMIGKNEAVAGFVVNPFGDNLIVPREVIASWTQTKKEILSAPKTESHVVRGGVELLKKQSNVRIGDPKDYPQELENALTEYAKTDKSIKKLWLRGVQLEGKNPEYLVIVKADKEEKPLFDAIGAAAQGHLGDMTMVVVGASSELGIKGSEGKKPFFKRGLF